MNAATTDLVARPFAARRSANGLKCCGTGTSLVLRPTPAHYEKFRDISGSHACGIDRPASRQEHMKKPPNTDGIGGEVWDTWDQTFRGNVGHTDRLRDSSIGLRPLAPRHRPVSSSHVETLTPLNAAGARVSAGAMATQSRQQRVQFRPLFQAKIGRRHPRA